MRRVSKTCWGAWRMLAAAGIAMAVASAAMPAGAKERRVERNDFEWSSRMEPGGTLEIKGISGSVRVVRARGDEAAVRARKTATKSDPGSVEIEVIEDGEDVTICARYPRPDGRLNECVPGDGSQRNQVRNNDVRVEFEVEVPAGVHVRAKTVNGDVSVRALSRSNVEAATVNGSVDLSTTGWGEASTVNGSIDATIGDQRSDGLEFSTVNGEITLTVPEDLDADVRAGTVNGSVTSDLPITVEGKTRRRTIRGTLGRGGPRLALETVNGSIALRGR